LGVWILVVVKWFSGGVTADFGALKSRSHGDATEIEQIGGGADLRVGPTRIQTDEKSRP